MLRRIEEIPNRLEESLVIIPRNHMAGGFDLPDDQRWLQCFELFNVGWQNDASFSGHDEQGRNVNALDIFVDLVLMEAPVAFGDRAIVAGVQPFGPKAKMLIAPGWQEWAQLVDAPACGHQSD